MTDWITRLVERMGYLGIALLMFLENLFPPIPSEVIMPLAGFTASDGRLGIAGVIAAGTAGTLAGALFWYDVARRIGADRLKGWAGRHGRWIALGPDEIGRLEEWFDRHHRWAIPLVYVYRVVAFDKKREERWTPLPPDAISSRTCYNTWLGPACSLRRTRAHHWP